jgi:hypothetical protein
MLVAYDDQLTEHLSHVLHPERPERVVVVAAELAWRGMLGERIDTRIALPSELRRAHPVVHRVGSARVRATGIAAGNDAFDR